ncbi:MAG TPA: AAA family ATPase [Xanthobacteraceae bacterium]|jgi:AAA+ superfamily predicted ATPase|nr:AAA family ATPase [Xanthobacteraceae bacterium]
MNEALAIADPAQALEPPFMQRLRLRARRRALFIRAQGTAAAGLAYDGAAIAHGEVERILTPAEVAVRAQAAFHAQDPEARALAQAIERADEQAYSDERWLRLSRTLGLSQPEVDLLSPLVAAEIDPMLRRVYGYLNDDAGACHASQWLAACLFEWPADVRLTAASAIVRWRVAFPAAPWTFHAPWAVDPAVVAWLIVPARGAAWADACVIEAPEAPSTCLYPDVLAQMRAFVAGAASVSETREPAPFDCECELIGAAGAGKRTLAKQLCTTLGRPMLVADAARLLGPEVTPSSALDNAVRATRAARLAGAVLYWHDADAAGGKLRAGWPIDGAGDLTIFGASAPLALPIRDNTLVRRFALPPLDRAGRLAAWAEHSRLPMPDAAAVRLLTPAEIAAGARIAGAGGAAAAQAWRQPLRRAAGELLTPLACPYGWDDIILAPGVRQHLMEFADQARLRWHVYEDWGFGRLCPLGKGIAAMFAGPSGTGKTMAAQVLAAALGMDLYRIDLAGVVNKYIGETEKRLKQVFDLCEHANVLLFFDEADALFGQRTQVKDAHDRYANIEIDYLLQRMEQFDGIAILATNRKNDIDPAFLRRLRFVIDFLPPGPAERRELWRLSLLPAAPDGGALLDALDWDFLAGKLIMTGADIKSAALGAAFLARAAGTRIGMQHVLHAARREMTKHGVVLRPGDRQE